MIRLTFTQSEIDTLFEGQKNYPHPKVRQKMQVLYLKSQKFSHHQICSFSRITRATLASYLKAYEASGIVGLTHLKSN